MESPPWSSGDWSGWCLSNIIQLWRKLQRAKLFYDSSKCLLFFLLNQSIEVWNMLAALPVVVAAGLGEHAVVITCALCHCLLTAFQLSFSPLVHAVSTLPVSFAVCPLTLILLPCWFSFNTESHEAPSIVSWCFNLASPMANKPLCTNERAGLNMICL